MYMNRTHQTLTFHCHLVGTKDTSSDILTLTISRCDIVNVYVHLTHQTLTLYIHSSRTKDNIYFVLTHQTLTENMGNIVNVHVHLTHQTLTLNVHSVGAKVTIYSGLTHQTPKTWLFDFKGTWICCLQSMDCYVVLQSPVLFHQFLLSTCPF